ncbi:MAG: thioredoxin family protein [Bacteroides sp.]|nr:thioredoxin family protein [Bacteroides sp.]
MNKFRIFSASVFTAAALTATAAVNVEFCYSDLNVLPEWYGTGKSDVYDVAIRVIDEGMIGSKIMGVKVPVPGEAGLTDATGWLSKELTLGKNDAGKKVAVPDITSADMVYADGYLMCTFAEPYTLTADGVYVGYSFTVDVAENPEMKQPIAVSKGTDLNSFFIHTGKTYLKWAEHSDKSVRKTYITMIAEADFGELSAGLAVGENLYYQAGSKDGVDVPIELIVHGAGTIESLDLSYTLTDLDGKTWEGTVSEKFATPEDVQFGHSLATSIHIGETFPQSDYTGTLTLEKINGVVNDDPAKTGALYFETLSRVPVRKPVMEEYTGLWCGYCPRGYASIEHMRKKYPDRFIAVSYHNGDDMTIMGANQYPSKVSGFPCAYLDRAASTIDAYSGTYGTGFGFELNWLEKSREFTPIDVKVLAWFDADDKDLIHVESEVTNVKSTNDSYKVVYVLLADGLSDKSWVQSNYYAGNIGYLDIPEMEEFVYGSSYVQGLVFNDIIVAHGNLLGEPDSLPYPMVRDQVNTGTYSFRVSEAKNVYAMPIIKDDQQLRVACLVVNSQGQIANADCQWVAPNKEIAGVETVAAAEAEVVDTIWFTLDGVRVANPVNGLYVKVDVMSDGSHKASKVSVK